MGITLDMKLTIPIMIKTNMEENDDLYIIIYNG